jgi:hypothetical protein
MQNDDERRAQGHSVGSGDAPSGAAGVVGSSTEEAREDRRTSQMFPNVGAGDRKSTPDQTSVRVAVRVRPQTAKERGARETDCVSCNLSVRQAVAGDRSFTFDDLYDQV